MEAGRVRALEALPNLRSKVKLAVGRRRKTHFLSCEEMEKGIEDNVERETAVTRKPVDDADTAIKQAQEEMRNAENAGLTTTKPETTFEEMANAIRDSLSDLASSDNRDDAEDGDDDKKDPELGNLSDDDQPGWVMGTISKTVQHRMETVRQQQIKLDESTQSGWEDLGDYFCERDKNYGTTELKVPAVVEWQREEDATCFASMTFGEPMETIVSVPRKWQKLQVTSRPGSSQLWLGLRKHQTHKGIPFFLPSPAPDSSMIQILKHVEPVIYNTCTQPSKLITIQISDCEEDMVMASSSPAEWICKLALATMYHLEKQ